MVLHRIDERLKKRFCEPQNISVVRQLCTPEIYLDLSNIYLIFHFL